MDTKIYIDGMPGFGSRERALAAIILDQLPPFGFSDSGVKLSMNNYTGRVFLINDAGQIAMMNGDELEIFHTLPYGGAEGFLTDLLNENTPDDLNGVDARYLREAAEAEGVSLPEAWEDE